MNLRFRSLALLFLLASASLAQAPDAGPPYRVGGNVTRPEKIGGDPPEYSAEARMERVQGVVILETVIDEHGDVTDVKVLKGLPKGLSEAAVDAVRAWKFKPARKDGMPVAVYYILTVNFTLKDEEPKTLRAQDVFWDFAMKHPDLAAHMKAGRREEALTYVQGLPDSSEVHFARAFLLTALRRYPEAAKETEGVSPGPEREMLVQLQALYAMMELRAEKIDAELDALESAPDSRETLLKRIRLLREKASLMDDGPERQTLLEEVERLEKQASPPK
ncbi:MAG TPA: energy transducer TonB [Thermoanaerobaculia bacterium]|nr:energy transducer TonB [Thermoanaerobaculia bacterium]